MRKTFLFCSKKPPKTAADIPRIIKTALNPQTKKMVFTKAVFFEELISFKERPVIREIKAGIKGKMQGLAKDKMPAAKAAKKEIFSIC
jgi:hypothetical protein